MIMNELPRQIKKVLEFELFHYSEYKRTLEKYYKNEQKEKPVYIKRMEYICDAIDNVMSKLNDDRKQFAKEYFFKKYHGNLQNIAFENNYDLSTMYRAKNKIIELLAGELGY